MVRVGLCSPCGGRKLLPEERRVVVGGGSRLRGVRVGNGEARSVERGGSAAGTRGGPGCAERIEFCGTRSVVRGGAKGKRGEGSPGHAVAFPSPSPGQGRASLFLRRLREEKGLLFPTPASYSRFLSSAENLCSARRRWASVNRSAVPPLSLHVFLAPLPCSTD